MQKAFLKKQNEVNSETKKDYTLKERMAHMSWCFKNEIFIWLEPYNYRGGRIVVNYKGDILTGTEIFVTYKYKDKDTKWWDIIWKLYTKYYEDNK